MKVSVNWLNDYVKCKDIEINELEKIFSLKLTEVEDKYQLSTATNVVIGEVLECEKHPDSDHLHVCKVRISNDEVSQIVCGAPNVRAGVKVLTALPGAVLPGDFKIKPSKIRGVESFGMLCSLQELGIDDKYVEEEYKNGIYLLEDDAPVGVDAMEYLKLNDWVLDLHLTPNRGDLLSMIGVSYDLGTVLAIKPEIVKPTLNCINKKNPVKVKLLTDKVFQYNARYIQNVKIRKSPWWLKQRLIAGGIRPINNVVDITNYILLEYGQPLHAFDADKLGNNIEVRLANENEEFVTLDKIKRTLSNGDIVITDGVNPVCLGGVMGGLDTEVTDQTTNIILESAQFNPVSIRKTSSRLNLRSESSYRFERKIDPNRCQEALNKAAMLLVELADGEVLDGISTVINKPYKPIVIKTSLSKINSYMGVRLTKKKVNTILDNMNFEYKVKDYNYEVSVPSRRVDYDNNYQDLIEDIVRFYAYDNIPLTLPKTNSCGRLTLTQRIEREMKNVFVSLGLNEVINYSLTSKEKLTSFETTLDKPIKIMMPFTEEREYMRLSLIPSLLENVLYNKSRKIEDVMIFEISDVYSENECTKLVSGAMCGIYSKSLWQGKVLKVDFFVVKGILDELFKDLGLKASYVPCEKKNMHPKKTALIKIGEEEIGYVGALHPRYVKENSLNETYVFELNYNKLFALYKEGINYQPVSKYPTIVRDLAIVCDKNISSEDIKSLILQTGKKLLVDVSLFDLYTDNSIGKDKKQLAFKLTFCNSEKTLDSSEVDKIIKSILNRLEYNYKAVLRQ